MIEIGFTGTRNGMTIAQHRELAKIMLCYHKSSGEFKWHHGMCVGADKECHDLARVFDFLVKGHPPINKRYESVFMDLDEVAASKEYIIRNHDIVDETDILIATPKEHREIQRSGTWATVRYAKKLGRRVVILPPVGASYTYE